MAGSIGHSEIGKPTEPDYGGHEDPGLVLEELDRISNSKFFRNAARCRQFLDYVVRHKLQGHAEQLKERTIGIEVFQRVPGYATGEDPVVRVQAGEVRRRLERYYQSLPSRPAVRIELQPGSYSPNFDWRVEQSDSKTSPADGKALPARRWTDRKSLIPVAAICLTMLVGVLAINIHHRPSGNPPTVQAEFWAPVFATQQPVLICLAKPVVYRPSFELYQDYRKSHPGSFQTEVERSNQVLPLDAGAKVPWRDVVPYPDYGVAVGDVYAAVRVSSLFGQIGKPSQVRIGANYSFEDLANSPSVIVGAFNNKWTMQVVHGLHFSFGEDNGTYLIREQTPQGRVWRSNLNPSQQAGQDFAIVARLLDSKTGQFTIVAAGITGSGTEAAGEFISNSKFLEGGLRAISSDWQKKNMELVLQTSVTDSVAGPPQVIASHTW